MSMIVADSAKHRLAVVPSGGPIRGHRVALPTGSVVAPCLMTVHTDAGPIRTPVEAVVVPEVPTGIVAVGEDLAEEWDVEVDQPQWRLERVEPVPIRTLTLELPTERDPAEAAKEIAAAGLIGELLWIPADGTDIRLSVLDLPHRVRHVDIGGKSGVVARITRDSAVELYASAVRAGVDIVILADCSGSMEVDDLPMGRETVRLWRSRQQWITRMDALKQSLRELLDMRLQVSGRISRLALVEFNHQVRQRFPRNGGMAQLDATSPADQLEQFRYALTLMRPDGGTHIGNALHEAANLLYQHGRPGNERLIVLVSDGADNWTPAGEQRTGEVVYAAQEPVSLMTHLHRDAGIRLHAIGISTAELFRRRGEYGGNPALVPNHTLLEELVKVGGGDPTTIGGMDILGDYFSGLATGIVHRMRERLTERRAPGPLPEHTRTALARLAASSTTDGERRRSELLANILESAGSCNKHAVRAFGSPLWDGSDLLRLGNEREMGATITDEGAVARSLSVVSRRLRPDNSVTRAAGTDLLEPLGRLLDRLESLARHDGAVTDRFAHEFSVRVASPAAIQVEVMDRVHNGLSSLLGSLSRLPDQQTGPEAPPALTSRPEFSMRD